MNKSHSNNIKILNTNLSKIKKSSFELKMSPVKTRNSVLLDISRLLKINEHKILKQNLLDLKALPLETPDSFKDRMTLTNKRIQQMILSLHDVIKQSDPLLVKEDSFKKLSNGLKFKKIKSPIGVILIIFESRPNVIIEAFSMGFKSGNALILKSGKECLKTSEILYKIIHQALKNNKLSKEVLWGLDSNNREIIDTLLQQKKWIDVVIPRGGEKLIEYVTNNSKIPIIKNDRGLCHIFVDQTAHLKKAIEIVVNAKTQRPSVCNSVETILIHEKMAKEILAPLYLKMENFDVEWFVCQKTKKIFNQILAKKLKNQDKLNFNLDHRLQLNRIHLAHEHSWNTEYLDQKINCKIVKTIDEALHHIQKYSSHHSEAILTENKKHAERFFKELDSSVLYWNASTRFTDGFEFGMGGEIGISTQKLHVRGPVGLEALTTERWVVEGHGQIRK